MLVYKHRYSECVDVGGIVYTVCTKLISEYLIIYLWEDRYFGKYSHFDVGIQA